MLLSDCWGDSVIQFVLAALVSLSSRAAANADEQAGVVGRDRHVILDENKKSWCMIALFA